MTLQELCDTIKVKESTVRTNFPKLVEKKAKEGVFISKDKVKYPNTTYFIQYGQPKQINRNEITIRNYTDEILPNEKWITSYLGEELEVSNLGRYRWTKNRNQIYTGAKGGNGYKVLTYNKKSYSVHRIILQSFDPKSDFENLTVDHINGNKMDNRLENLRWATNEQNVAYMIQKRGDLNKELTRLIAKYGSYQFVLQLLQSL